MKAKHLAKRLLGFVLVGAVVFSAACANDSKTSGSTKTPAADTGSSETVGAAANANGEANSSLAGEGASENALSFDEEITITCMSQGPRDTGITNFADNEFFKNLAEKSKVKIEFDHPIYGNESTEFDLMVAGGEYADLIWAVASSNGGDLYKGGDDAAVEDGVFRDLTPYIEKYMPNYWKMINSNDEMRRIAYTDSGKIVNLVSVEYNINDKSIEPQPAFAGIALRKDWLDEQGLAVPVTYDDWAKVLRSFKENYGCSQPLYLPSTGFWALAQFASGYGALSGMQNNDGTVAYGPMTEGWKKYITLLNQWYEEGLVGSEYVANDPMGIDMAVILSSQTGATLNVYTMKAMIENGIGDGAELIAAQLPVEKEGEVSQGGSNDGKVVAKKLYVTTHLSDEKLPQVLSMLDYLYGEEGILLAGIGVEGDTYTLNEDDIYLLTDKILKNPDGISVSEAIDTFLCPANLQLVKDWSRESATITDSELAMCQTWDKDGNALILPALTLTSEENTRYSKILTDVDTYMKEMTNNFIMGAVSIDEQWDTYVDTLKSMGIDEAIAIQQAAYDRYILK